VQFVDKLSALRLYLQTIELSGCHVLKRFLRSRYLSETWFPRVYKKPRLANSHHFSCVKVTIGDDASVRLLSQTRARRVYVMRYPQW